MSNIYSKKIEKLIKEKRNILIIPDLVLVKEGIACGDKLIISGQVDSDILRFSFSVENTCILSQAICSYLETKYNERNIEEIFVELKREYEKICNDNAIIFEMLSIKQKYYSGRYDCLISPYKLLLELINKLKETNFIYSEKPNTLQTMECDACTGSCRINWKNESIQKSDHHKGKTYTTEYLKKWLPLGKITLLDDEIKNLKKITANMEDSDYQFLSDHTMNSFVLKHIIKHCPEVLNKKWKATEYLIQKNEVTTRYFTNIEKYIKDTKLNIYFVKGYVSQKYYEDQALRIHSDYDLIAESVNDAFKLTHKLLNEGFTIRPNLFSFKPMYNKIKEQEISGHFHLQKIIDDMYMFEIDLTFPGFPINRVELFYPRVVNNSISVEDQIIITLLHLFKHSNIYMKDINDLYYMLQEDINYEYLLELILKHNLKEFFDLAITYITRNYKIDQEKICTLIKKFNVDTNSLKKYPEWPYDLESHLNIKKIDFDNRTKNNCEFERIYLFPIIIFRDLLDINSIIEKQSLLYKIDKINECIYKITKDDYEFYLTSIGIFIENYIDTTKINRINYLKIFERFLQEINNPKLFSIPYATDHFYVRVI